MIDTTSNSVTDPEAEVYVFRGCRPIPVLRVTIDLQRVQNRIMNLRANRGRVPVKTDYSSDL